MPTGTLRAALPRLGLTLLFCSLTLHACNRIPPPEETSYPTQPVEIIADVHGIPHIMASNDADAFWAQGYVMAELRPAQSEIWRLYSQGRRAELLGERALNADYFVRSMNFLGQAEKDWPEIRTRWPDLAEAAVAFAQGFNDKYAEYQSTGWPATLQVLLDAGHDVEPWTPQHVVAISQLLGFGLAGSPDVKLELTILQALLSPAVADDLLRFNKPVTAAAVPNFFARIGLQSPPPYRPAAQPRPDVEAANPFADPRVQDGVRQTLANVRQLSELRFGGSNHFAVAGDRTADGIAVLESDTHQGVPTPGPYVLFHLSSNRVEGATGNLDIIGASFPGAPMVVFGHNGKVAWAPTVGFSDLTDFYWEFADPEDRTRVLRPNGESLPTTQRAETFKIRQEDGSFRYETVTVRDIPGHGPILPSEMFPLPVPLKVSVRWAGHELPGAAPSVYQMAFAETMDDLFDANRKLAGGTLGFGFATTENRIASSWLTKHPKRDASGPFKPWFIIPATEGPHWEGFIPHEELPHEIDPERGYVWAANSDPVGATFDNDPGTSPHYIGFAYAIGYRGQRLDDLLSALTQRGDVSMEEITAVMLDQKSLFADQLIAYFEDALTRGAHLVPPTLRPYADAVTLWDRKAVPDSYEATIFYAWAYQLMADMLLDDYQLLDVLSGSNAPMIVPAFMHWLRETAPIIDGIDDGSIPFPSRTGRNYFHNHETGEAHTRDELIVGALETAVAHLKATFAAGPNVDPEKLRLSTAPLPDPDDLTTWKWKRMLYRRSRHELAEIDPAWEQYDEYRGVGGNVDTVNVGQFVAYRDGKLEDRFILTNAPSNRFLWRMEPDGIRAQFMVPWGQSEDPASPHYLDLLDDYTNNVFRDFPFTDAEIAGVTVERRVLAPAR